MFNCVNLNEILIVFVLHKYYCIRSELYNLIAVYLKRYYPAEMANLAMAKCTVVRYIIHHLLNKASLRPNSDFRDI